MDGHDEHLGRAEELASEHWNTYVRVILEAHEVDEGTIDKIGVHYRTAFIHGFKHGVESVKGIEG